MHSLRGSKKGKADISTLILINYDLIMITLLFGYYEIFFKTALAWNGRPIKIASIA